MKGKKDKENWRGVFLFYFVLFFFSLIIYIYIISGEREREGEEWQWVSITSLSYFLVPKVCLYAFAKNYYYVLLKKQFFFWGIHLVLFNLIFRKCFAIGLGLNILIIAALMLYFNRLLDPSFAQFHIPSLIKFNNLGWVADEGLEPMDRHVAVLDWYCQVILLAHVDECGRDTCYLDRQRCIILEC